MRLVNADALKEATKHYTDSDGFNPVWQIINNAPTVSLLTTSGIDDLCRLRSDLKSGLHVGSTLRTQAQMNKFVEVLDEIIDNAPIVNVCPNCEYKKNYDYLSSSSSYKELQALRKFKKDNERPQGEWKLDNTEQFCYCSYCEDTYYPRPIDPSWHYCPHCGADMRKGDES